MNIPLLSRFNSPQQRKLVKLSLVLVLVGILLLIGSMFTNRSSLGLHLNRVVAAQQEILRINKLAESHDPDVGMRQVQSNIHLLISSDIVFLEPHRKNTSGENRIPEAITRDIAVNDAAERLETAARRNRLEQEYLNLMEEQLTRLRQLTTTATSTQRNEIKSTLNRILENTDFLLEEISSAK